MGREAPAIVSRLHRHPMGAASGNIRCPDLEGARRRRDAWLRSSASTRSALQRLLLKGWVAVEWGARYDTLTSAGRKQLVCERAEFQRIAGAIQRVLEMD